MVMRDRQCWRAPILLHFGAESASASRLTVVSDPDQLLTEPGIVLQIRERGFELFTYDDSVAFRFAYESRFRQHWDRGESTHLVVVIRTARGDLHGIPYDLLEEARANGRVLDFSLTGIFPALAPNIVGDLDHQHFDVLAQAVGAAAPGGLGTNATCDFILRHVFEIAPELIKTPSELLRTLLRRHYQSRVFPARLDTRFVELLTATGSWTDWPLDQIVRSKEAFLGFLQERWPHFLLSKGFPVVPGCDPPQPSMAGPIQIPFDHDDIRVYIDNLFAEGLLEPTTAVAASAVQGSWYRVGVAGDAVDDVVVRLERLLESIEDTLPETDADHTAWMQFAARWGEAINLRWKAEGAIPEDLAACMTVIHDRVEVRFGDWMLARYASIHSLSHLPKLTTLDKVSRYLAHYRNEHDGCKLALIVVDGLAIDQWMILRESLGNLACEETQAFAWVPTLTAVSRQSIFAGEPPFFYGSSIGTTQKEPHHWSRFWDDHGLRGPAVAYVCQKKQEQDEAFASRVMEAAENSQCKVIGTVVGMVDQMMHGTVTGTGGMHAGVRHWAAQGHFRKLVEDLLALGFEVFVTADHGNIEGSGMGKPNVGEIADERGQRAHVFPHALTRANVHKDYPATIEWPSPGLPAGFLPLLPIGRSAFIDEGKRTVAHGGISLEEVIVPFVRISQPA